MGRSTKAKQEDLVKAEIEFQQKFTVKTKELEAKLAEPIPHVSEDFKEYEGFFVRDKNTFSLKTKSKDRDKQRLEFVRHVFHKYPVPAFMFNAWETKPTPTQHHRYDNVMRPRPSGFATKDDYRLWYICIATGGSLYKEYTQSLFTKRECATFLTCQHNITIDQAIVYAIAYAESKDVGKSLRIAKSKINARVLDTFWREVIRFFARQNPESKETIDDIVDYIVYKQGENPAFTIINKGHTIESLNKKVETWHQDLRRLKLIGDSFWEGIPVNDRSYTRKHRDGSIEVWKFTQIKSAKELQKEGNLMRHCVLSYKSGCISGKTSIWSMMVNDNKKLTIEVQERAVAQVRGLANRPARPDERTVVNKWVVDSGFYY